MRMETRPALRQKRGRKCATLFPELPEAIENTVKIAERCQVEFDFSHVHLPPFPLPEGETAKGYLRPPVPRRASPGTTPLTARTRASACSIMS